MIVKLLTEHHLEFLSFKGGCTGSTESIHVKLQTSLEITCHLKTMYSDQTLQDHTQLKIVCQAMVHLQVK